ncbi:MAG: winged helix-turn-helix domain-containing protein [Minwuia sp.]|uniref:winged helix-turn-helix domain-containing protein n=1 Tax=Minwuia sp. TaxID=2493630 RepID=UPI003A8AEC8A
MVVRQEIAAEVPADAARRILLDRQQLSRDPGRRIEVDELRDVIRRMGFVQVDSVNTVERAHHMILHARSQSYRPKMLERLVEKDRALFENWTHDASVIPTEFYPYWKHRFARHAEKLTERWRKWRREGFEELFDDMRGHVTENGPTRARELAPEEKQEAGWWNWHPSKTALEFLWRTGELAVCHREGFEKFYDLSHRVIPPDHHDAEVGHDAFIDWCCRGALDRLGIATPGELAAFWGLISPAEAKQWAETEGLSLPRVNVRAIDGSRPRVALADPAVLEHDARGIDLPSRIRVLSPFDPVLRDRKRAERLFGFDYRIEIFVPEAKRKYGYYVFPLLEDDRFVGRIDMKRTAPGGPLHVRKLWWEPGVRRSKGRLQRLESELERIRRFAGCSDVTWAADALD